MTARAIAQLDFCQPCVKSFAMCCSSANLIRLFGRWNFYGLCAIVCLIVTSGAYAGDAEPAKRVLIISTGSRLAPGFVLVDQQLLQALEKIPAARIETYAENLDIVRFPAERSQRIFSEYLAAKYSAYPPDLIILVFVGNLGIPGHLLPQLFPGRPIVVAGLTEEEFHPDQFGNLVSGIAQRVDPRGTLDLILRLQPDTRRIVVVGGTADVDREVLQRVKAAGQLFKKHGIHMDFWDNLSMAELRQSVSTLTQNTAILYARMFRDAAGQVVISSQVARSIAQWANVPVYVMADANLGTGAVGGAVASIESFGKRAGELARLILNGADPKSLPFEIRTDSVPTFNWGALKRWGIPESRLPPGSVVRFKPQSAWDRYRWYIVGVLLTIAVQAGMIVDLLLQHRRRRRIQTELRESQQLMELACSASDLGMWSRDLKGDFIWANGPMRSLFGFAAADPISFESILNRIHPEDRARMLLEVEHAEVAGVPFQGEFRIVPREGTERWVLAKGRMVVDLNNRDERRMGVVLDMTERKRAESELRRNRDELAHMMRITTMGELAASLAHELNQPLTAILSNAQAAQRFLSNKTVNVEEVREILHDIVEDNNRASEVIRRMRALVKKENLEFSSIDLRSIMREIVLLVHSDAVLRNMRISVDVSPDLPHARGDKVQLQQVLLNLLLNAFDAMKDCEAEEREVLVRVAMDGGHMIRTSIRDCGTGMTVDKLENIFQPFYTTKRDGLGMGLSISRSIIEAHGGRLWAENNEDRGATFYFTVPVAKSDEVSSNPAAFQ